MNHKIGAKIRELRERGGIEQKELSDRLGVPKRMVARWEKGRGYPDVRYILPIANFFNVTVDCLFDYEKERDRRIDDYCERYESHKKDSCPPEERIKMMRRALAEFPGDEKLLIRLANALYDKWVGYKPKYGYGSKPKAEYEISDHEKIRSFGWWKESADILEKLLSVSVNDSIRGECRRLLAEIYGRVGYKKKQSEIAGQCGDIPECRQSILSVSSYGEDKYKHEQESMLALLAVFGKEFLAVANHISDKDLTAEAYGVIINLYKFIFSDGNYGNYHAALSELYADYAAVLMNRNERSGAIDALEEAYTHAKEYDDQTRYIICYTAPLVNQVIEYINTAAITEGQKKQLPLLLEDLKRRFGGLKPIHRISARYSVQIPPTRETTEGYNEEEHRYTSLIQKIERDIMFASEEDF